MPGKTKIEWATDSWNPVTGCTQVSPGCDHCYALTFAERFRGVPNHPYEQGFDLKLWPERLDIPLHWKKPRRIFVNSMSDLFHRDVPDAFIQQVFDVMASADQHTYLVLTKRPDRMMRLLQRAPWWVPLPHIWLGTSVELDRFQWRVDKLRQTPAVVRFISAEPLLGPLRSLNLEGIHWVITGGESGHGHRYLDPKWVCDIRDKCLATGVAYFHKQWGGTTPRAGGRLVDGQTWDELPDLTKLQQDSPAQLSLL